MGVFHPPGRGREQALVPQARASSNVATDNTSQCRWTRAGSVLLVLSHFHPRLSTPSAEAEGKL